MVYKFGEGSSEEKIHKIFEENVRKIFGNSKWIFFDKKSFIFGSSQFNADGDYSITDNVFKFHGQSIAGAIFTLDGFIRPQKDTFVLDAIYTVAMIIVSATAWWAMPTLQVQAVDFLAFVGWALPTIPYRLAADGPNDDQGLILFH